MDSFAKRDKEFGERKAVFLKKYPLKQTTLTIPKGSHDLSTNQKVIVNDVNYFLNNIKIANNGDYTLTFFADDSETKKIENGELIYAYHFPSFTIEYNDGTAKPYMVGNSKKIYDLLNDESKNLLMQIGKDFTSKFFWFGTNTPSSLNESDEDVLKDSNGKIIGIGDIVRTSQEGGGVLAPSEPTVGEVVMRNGELCVKYRKEGRDFDQYVSLLGQNNKIVIKKLNEDDANTESDEDLVSKAERSISEYKNKAKLSNGKEYYNRAFSNVKALRDINRSQFDILLRKLNSILSDNRDSLNEDNSINNTYTHFAVRKSDNKIVNGWEYKDIDNESIKEYAKIDLKNDFPNNKLSDFKIVTKKSLENSGVWDMF